MGEMDDPEVGSVRAGGSGCDLGGCDAGAEDARGFVEENTRFFAKALFRMVQGPDEAWVGFSYRFWREVEQCGMTFTRPGDPTRTQDPQIGHE